MTPNNSGIALPRSDTMSASVNSHRRSNPRALMFVESKSFMRGLHNYCDVGVTGCYTPLKITHYAWFAFWVAKWVAVIATS